MSSVIVAGNTSGSITLQAPDVAGTTVLNLPATSGTIITTGGGSAGSFTSISDSSLTSGRVTYATTGGELTDSANMTFDGTTLTATIMNVSSSGATIPLEIQSSTGANAIRIKGRVSDGIGTVRFYESTSTTSYGIIQAASTYFTLGTEIATPITFQTNGTTRMTLDLSGNLGLGITPSASWITKAFQVGGAGVVTGNTSGSGFWAGRNFVIDGGSTFKYITTDYAEMYKAVTGQHQWFTAPSGTAGNAITFTQAMTLDSSGNLGIGTTATEVPLIVNGVNGVSIASLGVTGRRYGIRNDGSLNFVNYTTDPNTVTTGMTLNSAGNLAVTGQISGGYYAPAAGTTAMAFGSYAVTKVTPNATATFTTTVAPAGSQATLIILTSGASSYTITFGTGFKTTGTLATGATTARYFMISFVSDGTNMLETGRTVAIA